MTVERSSAHHDSGKQVLVCGLVGLMRRQVERRWQQIRSGLEKPRSGSLRLHFKGVTDFGDPFFVPHGGFEPLVALVAAGDDATSATQTGVLIATGKGASYREKRDHSKLRGSAVVDPGFAG